MKLEEAQRAIRVYGRQVRFWVHRSSPLKLGDFVSESQWILIADAGSGWVLMERLGEGEEPEKGLEEYSDVELQELWRTRGL